MAGEVLMSISKDERERAIFRNRRIALANYESDMVTAERIGRAAGLVEGEAKGRATGLVEGEAKGHANVARNLMKMNMPIEQIAIVTGLTTAEIKALRDTD